MHNDYMEQLGIKIKGKGDYENNEEDIYIIPSLKREITISNDDFIQSSLLDGEIFDNVNNFNEDDELLNLDMLIMRRGIQ